MSSFTDRIAGEIRSAIANLRKLNPASPPERLMDVVITLESAADMLEGDFNIANAAAAPTGRELNKRRPGRTRSIDDGRPLPANVIRFSTARDALKAKANGPRIENDPPRPPGGRRRPRD